MLVVDPTRFPIRRQIKNKTVLYVWSERGDVVAEQKLVARLDALAVPPAWNPVSSLSPAAARFRQWRSMGQAKSR